MTKRQKVVGTVAFSGDMDERDPETASIELQRAGFEVERMPEKFRPHLLLVHDDFLEITIGADLSSDINRELTKDDWEIVHALWAKANAIVPPSGGNVDDVGVVERDHKPFDHLFSDLRRRTMR